MNTDQILTAASVIVAILPIMLALHSSNVTRERKHAKQTAKLRIGLRQLRRDMRDIRLHISYGGRNGENTATQGEQPQ